MVGIVVGWLLGFLLSIPILWTLGIIVLVIGLILLLLSLGPSPRVGRRYY